MDDGITVDFSDLNALSADLDRAAADIEKFALGAIKFTSVNIKRAASRKVGRRRHFRQAAQAIDFDVKKFFGFGAAVLQSEIGYSKDRPAGELGNLVEYGAPNSPNALTPGNELQSSMRENEADFVRGVTKAMDDSLKEVGL